MGRQIILRGEGVDNTPEEEMPEFLRNLGCTAGSDVEIIVVETEDDSDRSLTE
ncbi:MAG TPA: hypothetical protein VFT49_03005 [Candidatus Saccharimonadales bacterium]|nr:hypothetical protein [Candidatus Saccharimonadales bacterium]